VKLTFCAVNFVLRFVFYLHTILMLALQRLLTLPEERKIDNLKERAKVLERIVTDEHKSNSLNEEIDNLRQ
jgi:hypothetical protein